MMELLYSTGDKIALASDNNESRNIGTGVDLIV